MTPEEKRKIKDRIDNLVKCQEIERDVADLFKAEIDAMPEESDEQISRKESAECVKRRQFQEVKYSPDPDFVALRKEITKRMIEKYVADASSEVMAEVRTQLFEGFFHWLDQGGE